jgi:cytochrome c
MRSTLSQLAVGAALTACAAAARSDEDVAAVAHGKRLFLRCASCHDVAGADIVKNGPSLKGVLGRKVASYPGYVYSASLSGLSFTWDEAHLDAWLQKPTSVAPGTTMAFEGISSAADRKALIDYLRAQQP